MLNSTHADRPTLDAAKTLTGVLNSIDVMAIHIEIDTDKVSKDGGHAGKDSPQVWVKEKRNLIVVSVGLATGVTIQDASKIDKHLQSK